MDKKKQEDKKVKDHKIEEVKSNEQVEQLVKAEKDEIENLVKKIEELEGQAKRALADYQNLERRTAEEKSRWIKFASQGLLLKLLPVLDTMMLAQKHNPEQGLTLVIGQFLDALKQEGLDKIETLDRLFDPKVMECIDTIEGEDGKVLEEIRSGYILNGQVLRAAQVKVGKSKEKNDS